MRPVLVDVDISSRMIVRITIAADMIAFFDY
jgi:hypothetical protein